ncbi:MAG: cytochrome d ubiquinol oxidase subunit II [Lachnospiraceae bacterium]|nr:cytochrome d ubiquinol oxidase subunit II [Lachnospiraceae bacterium]
MDLNTLWFILIIVLFSGFFVLEGFDYGVGTLLPFVAKNDTERRVVLNTIGPHWDANEVWLLTAGGAIFAAFPNWYATLFSGFYLALFLILLALIVRGVAIDFRSKKEDPSWRKTWDILFCVGSLLPALLFGVAVSNLMTGVPIDANMEYAGTFFTLLTPFTLLGGVTFLLVLTFHGMLFLGLKNGVASIEERIKALSPKLGIVMLVVTVLWVVYAAFTTNLITNGIIPIITVALAAVLLIAAVILQVKGSTGKAFISSSLAIVMVTITAFASMFPNVMISTTSADYSLTIYNASSSPYTLKIMTIVALTAVPVVLVYLAWSYWIFRKRVTEKDLHY